MNPTVYESSQVDNVTVIHPLSLVALAVVSLLVLAVKRQNVVFFLFALILLITPEQRIAVAGLDFYTYRVLILVGLLRVLVRSEGRFFRYNKLDRMLLLYALTTAISFIVLRGDFSSVVNRVGFLIDVTGLYFLLRSLLDSFDAIRRLIRFFIVITVCVAFGMLIEQTVQVNVFGFLHGNTSVVWREGAIRSTAGFAHPIAAGVFGASMFPLCVGQIGASKSFQTLSILGSICSAYMVYVSGSSGPLLAFVAAVFSTLLFPWRMKMAPIRLFAVIVLIFIQLNMDSPIWALIGRVGVVTGSTSYHRYMLVDQFIRRFPEWWLFGTQGTGHWGHPSLQLWDVANQYVRVGVDGGFVAFLCFLSLLGMVYKSVGLALRVREQDVRSQREIWSLGAALFTHMVAFIGISYSFQILAMLLFTVASGATLFEVRKGRVMASELNPVRVSVQA